MPSLLGNDFPNRITFYRGDSHTIQLTLKRPDPSDPTSTIVVDLTTVTEAVLTCKVRAADTDFLFQSTGAIVTPPGTNGVLRFDIAPSDTTDVPPGLYPYDLQVKFNDGKVYTMYKDLVRILEDVNQG